MRRRLYVRSTESAAPRTPCAGGTPCSTRVKLSCENAHVGAEELPPLGRTLLRHYARARARDLTGEKSLADVDLP
jgi:hypothetical protein